MRLLIGFLAIILQADDGNRTAEAPSQTLSEAEAHATNTFLTPQFFAKADCFDADLLDADALADADYVDGGGLIGRHFIRVAARNDFKGDRHTLHIFRCWFRYCLLAPSRLIWQSNHCQLRPKRRLWPTTNYTRHRHMLHRNSRQLRIHCPSSLPFSYL